MDIHSRDIIKEDEIIELTPVQRHIVTHSEFWQLVAGHGYVRCVDGKPVTQVPPPVDFTYCCFSAPYAATLTNYIVVVDITTTA